MRSPRRIWRDPCVVRPLVAVALTLLIALPAHAQLFGGDDEARKAILQIREQIKVLQQRETEMTARLDRMESAQRNQLELVNQLESLRQENARLRGQVETLSNEVATLQKRNRDLYTDLDARLKKMEPQSVTVDGRSAAVDRAELAAYETPARAVPRRRLQGLAAGLPAVRRAVSRLRLRAGRAVLDRQRALRDQGLQVRDRRRTARLVERYADSPRVPDALLSMAESQVQLGDRKSANATLNRVIKEFPETEAAKIARDRLPATR